MLRTLRRFFIAGLLTMAGMTVATSQSPANRNAERGRKVTEKWCVLCHAVAGARKPTAPSFLAVVRRPGRDDTYLRNFLHEDHFPMTTYRLFEREKEDVLEYFRSLRSRRE